MKHFKQGKFVSSFVLMTGIFFGFQGMCLAAVNIVTEIAPKDTLTAGVWEATDVRPGGVASIADLTGLGGDLENNQPMPVGAALLTTDFTDAAKAEIGVYHDYGLAGDIIASLQLAFDYYKAANANQNVFAAPSIKLTFYNPVCVDPVSAGDCFGTLVWEYYWQGIGNPATDVWTPVSIDQNNGQFWWNGGFGFGNGAGGPPLNTLAGWLSDFSADFPGASLVTVSIGVGSYNQGQNGYFDNVSITHNFNAGFDEVYDFEPAQATVSTPIPVLSLWSTVLMILLLLVVGFGILGRKALVI